MARSIDAPARCRAFLSALRETGNAELAFAQSGVNRSWAYWRRKRDTDFARAWSAARAAGLAALGTGGLPHHPDDGRNAPLIRIGGVGGRAARVRRTWWADFTGERKRLFLAALRITCNASASARAVEIAPSTAHRHRRLDPRFAAAWDEAMAAGEAQLTLMLYGMHPDQRHENLFDHRLSRREALRVYRQLMLLTEPDRTP